MEDFLFHEADLLDNWRLDEWLGLLDRRLRTTTCRRTTSPMAITASRCSPSPTTSCGLRERIIRLKDPNCHAEYPPSHTRRMIANVRITGMEGDLILVAANFAIFRFRRNEGASAVRRPLSLQAQAHRRGP